MMIADLLRLTHMLTVMFDLVSIILLTKVI